MSICTLTGGPPLSPPSSLANRRKASTKTRRELLQSAKRAARHSAMRRTASVTCSGLVPKFNRTKPAPSRP
jgi:hypothetical protein